MGDGSMRRTGLAVLVAAMIGAAAPLPLVAVQPALPTPVAPSKYERDSLLLQAAANRAAERANTIAEGQGRLALWQILLGGFSLVFAGIAAGAAIAAALYARKAATETKRSADIADRVLNSVERPFLVVEVIESGIEVREDSVKFGETTYRLRNYGRTPAIVTRQHFALENSEERPPPVNPATHSGRQVVHGIIIGPGDYSEEYETPAALPIISAFAAQKEGRPPVGREILFMGYVTYRDLSGGEYATGFCFLHRDDEFVIASPVRLEGESEDLYNYDRKLT